jgi:starvation-inducible DNA-binding protein
MPKTTNPTSALEPAHIGLSEDSKVGVVNTLNTLLSDEFALYTKTRNYHWNVRGPRFHALHLFFESQYEEIDELMDEVAENARQFGGIALGRMADFLEHTNLKEAPSKELTEDQMIEDLLVSHETIIQFVREQIDVAGDKLGAQDAADFLTSVLEAHNKMAWMLRSHLTAKK